jgi:hypothetical protein
MAMVNPIWPIVVEESVVLVTMHIPVDRGTEETVSGVVRESPDMERVS